MNESAILNARIQALALDLDRANHALESAKVDEDLRERVRVPFLELITAQQNSLTSLRNLLGQGKVSAENGWSQFQIINNDCQNLLKECLEFVQGALARKAGTDFGICRIADALLMDIGHRSDISWTRFTMLAVGEFFHDMSEIIRLRFPDPTIWSLPVACHEFGHFAEQKISERYGGKTRYPIQEILDQERFNGAKNVSYLRELFADLFATFALGPAYACTCILTRFDPEQAHVDGNEHPSSAKRAYFILKALDKMNSSEITKPYGSIIDRLKNAWGKDVDPVAAGQLNVWLESLDIALNKKSGVKFKGWAGASALIPAMMARDLPHQALQQAKAGKANIPDVLNAAWICRLENFDELDRVNQIGDNAMRLCHEISLKSH